jgi:hypothetical protein
LGKQYALRALLQPPPQSFKAISNFDARGEIVANADEVRTSPLNKAKFTSFESTFSYTIEFMK